MGSSGGTNAPQQPPAERGPAPPADPRSGLRAASLQVEILLVGTDQPLSARIALVAFRPYLGGRRWFALCPRCEKRSVRLYLPRRSDEVACRLCHGLVHASAQRHDARIDLARRDPKGFLEGRARLRGLRSRLVTVRIGTASVEAVLAPRRGRGWGVKSMTSYKRAVEELLAGISPDCTG